MYRKFDDELSNLELKIGLEFKWIYGYRLFSSLGDFSAEIQDGGSGTVKLIDSTRSTSGASPMTSLALTSIALSAAIALF